MRERICCGFGHRVMLMDIEKPLREVLERLVAERSVSVFYTGGMGEFDELFARTGEFLKEVIDPLTAQGKNVLIVGHGAMNLSIIGRIRGIPIREFWSPGIESCKMIRLI